LTQIDLGKDGADRFGRWLVESTDQAACCLSLDGKIQQSNRAFCDALRIPSAQLVGNPLTRWLTSASQPSFERILHKGQVEKTHGEVDLEAVSGTILPIHVTCTPLPFAVDLLFVTISDLSQKRSNQQLRDTIKQRDEFIHALEHELRNPLAPLRNAIAILKIKGVPDPDMQWALGVIDRQVGMMNRLLDKLLDVSRLRSGKITMHKTRLDATIILAKAVKSVRSLMDGRKQELTVALPPKPIWVHADASLLEQILTNLLTSAAKNTRDGGQICLIAEEHGPEVVIKVRDSGNGHTPETLARIFEPYVPVAEAAESKSGDLEIGLTTARGLVELHGGRIHAQSEGLGKGTEFVIQLPLQQGN